MWFFIGKSTISMMMSELGHKLILTSVLVSEYVRSPAKNLYFFAGYLADWQ